MKKTVLIALVSAVGLLTPVTNAEITGVTGPVSSDGVTLPAIITPPSDVLDDFVTNTGMQGFDEAKVVTTAAYTVDGGGSIPAGTLVSSHMIFLNSEGPTLLSHGLVMWTFSQPILGVMSDGPGNLEAASTLELGAPATNYTVTFPGSGPAAPFAARGLEGSDLLVPFVGNQLTVGMTVTEPGDWIRVVTCAQGSQGFWKNNPDAWTIDPITIGGREYTKAEAIALMQAPTKGNKALTMFPQVVAAKLNVDTAGGGCLPACIQDIIDLADAWMADNDPEGDKVKANSAAWQEGEVLYELLDAYNNEELTCPD